MLIPYKATVARDQDDNEITAHGKFWAGFALITFTLISAICIIAHWPDRLPKPGDNDHTLYAYRWFHVTLITEGPVTGNYIHINTLLLILVAFGGFLGNMIYIAASFTPYVPWRSPIIIIP